ncbi:MAG: hypothetical protein IKZ53_03230 [Selenomonadaceae bacterium]|nr:hypothetical protein [Selenomonadaceae bacterium]
MTRKILSAVFTTLLALSLIGCGKELPEASADKSVLAYAQLYSYGSADEDAFKATGLTEDDVKKIREQIFEPIYNDLIKYALKEETIQAVEMKFFDRMKAISITTSTIIKDDKEHPVVELITPSINREFSTTLAEEDKEFLAFKATLAELRAQGLTDEQLKGSPEFQKFALDSVGKFVSEFTMNEKATINVTCDAVKGSDGKLYWRPHDEQAVKNYIMGIK